MIRSIRFLPMSAAVVLSLLAGAPTALAANDVNSPTLQRIMLKLGEDMQQVTQAIAMEDWQRVAELAPGIGQHEQPPLAEKTRILRWLSSNAGQFRKFDTVVHERAAILGDAAQQEDGDAVIAAFADLQRGCLACHRVFRASFIERFHRRGDRDD